MNPTLCSGKSAFLLPFIMLLFFSSVALGCKTRVPSDLSATQNTEVTTAPVQKASGDSLYCLTQTVIYRDFVAKNRWEEALDPWRKVFLQCTPRGQNFYIDGGNIYRYFIRITTDSLRKEACLDTLMLLYDLRMDLFDNPGFVSGRKGLDLLAFRPNEEKAAYQCLLKAFELEKNNTQTAVLQSLITTAVSLNRQGILDTALVLSHYARVKDVIYYNLRENIRDTLLYLQTNRGIDQVVLPWADCKLLSATFKTRIPAATAEELKNIVHIFELLQCYDLEGFRMATERLHMLQPGPETAFYQGLNAFTRRNYSAALEYFKQAAEQYKDPIKKAASLVGAGRTYEAMQEYESARDMARKALAADPKNGRAYILIGDAYISAAKKCGNGDPLSEGSIYWAAADQYRFASQVDPSVHDEAAAKMNECRLRFPEKKLLFFHQLQLGATYTVGCWIQEKTIVRARPE